MKEEKKIYERECPNPTNNPKCYKILTYSGKYTFRDAELKNSKCQSCCQIKLDTGNKTKFIRSCPNPYGIDKCKKLMHYQYKHQFINAEYKNALCWQCSKLSTRQKKKQHNIERLLSSELDAFYWVGFLLADGSFNTNGTFQLGLSVKDSEHFYKFVDFINYNLAILIGIGKESSYSLGKNNISLRLQDYINVNLICQKFNIHNKKTYNPPNVEVFRSFDLNQMKSLVAGFIDGDGTISKSGGIRFGCHHSWIEVLKYFATFISQDFAITESLSCKGIRINGVEAIRKFKSDLLSLNLPILKRKWDRIDENKLSRTQKTEKFYSEFKLLYMSYSKQVDIAKILGVKPAKLTKFIKRIKKEEHDIKK